MNSSVRFWNLIAGLYARTPVADERAYNRKLDLTSMYLTGSSSVLEFGCGTGSTAIHHAPSVSEYCAIDSSSKMINISKEKADALGLKNTYFHNTSFEDFDILDESYDAVLGMSILHLITDWEQAIDKVFALLKPEGYFVTSSKCVEANLPTRFLLFLGNSIGLIPQISFFSVNELRNKVVSAGFEIVEFWQPKENEAAFIVAKKRK